MTQKDIPSESRLGSFYSHISRLFNSSVNILASMIFGWAAFVGLAWNVLHAHNVPDLPTLRLVIFSAGIFIWAAALYNLYFRVLHFSKLLYQIEVDLKLLKYIENLDLLPGVRGMVSRKDKRAFSLTEILAVPFLIAYFVLTLYILTL